MARLDVVITDYALPKTYRYESMEVLDTEVDAMVREIEAIVNRYEVVEIDTDPGECDEECITLCVIEQAGGKCRTMHSCARCAGEEA